MNIEVIEFYPIDSDHGKGTLTGTIKVKLVDLGVIIRGISVSKRKNTYFFVLPGKFCNSHETGEKIRFPYIVFEDHNRQKVLISAIRKNGIQFIEAWLNDPKRSSNFLSQKPKNASEPQKASNLCDPSPQAQKAKEEYLKSIELHVPLPSSKARNKSKFAKK